MTRLEESALDEADIARLARIREVAKGYRAAAFRALAFAKLYRFEEGPRGEREKACMMQVAQWRQVVRDLHAGRAVPAVPEGPGLVRARAASQPDSERKTG